jgi:hypothetical protein
MGAPEVRAISLKRIFCSLQGNFLNQSIGRTGRAGFSLLAFASGNDDPPDEIGDNKGNNPGSQPYENNQKPQKRGVYIEQLSETT